MGKDSILNIPTAYHTDNYTIPTIQITFWLMIVCMGICAYETIRRKYFELFYFTHHLYLVIYCAALWHATSLWYFLIAGLGLWFTDRLIRFTRGCATLDGVSLKAHAKGHSDQTLTQLQIKT